MSIMKIQINFFFLILFLFISLSLFSQDKSRTLNKLYTLLEKTAITSSSYSNILEEIIDKENDIEKIVKLSENEIPLIAGNKNKSALMGKVALIFQLSGMIDKAAYYFEEAYNINPSEENIYLLISAAALLLETGETVKSAYIANFIADSSVKLDKQQQGKFLIAYNYILDNKKEIAIPLLDAILKNTNNSQLLFSVYRLSDIYNISKIKKNAESLIVKIFGENSFDEIKMYEYPVTPLMLFSGNNEQAYEDTNNTEGVFALLQIGVYSYMENATEMKNRVEKLNLPVDIITESKSGKTLYKIFVPTKTEQEAENYTIILKENSIESFRVF